MTDDHDDQAVSPGEMIESIAAAAYQRVMEPVDLGLAITEAILEETLGLDCDDPHVTLLAAQIIGAMLEAGWRLPGGTEPQ